MTDNTGEIMKGNVSSSIVFSLRRMQNDKSCMMEAD